MVAQHHPQPHRWTPEEYLAFERASDTKHEYWDGQIYDMAGASDNHETVKTNVVTSLNTQVRKRDCKVYSSNMRIKVDKRRYNYPDVVVVCGERKFDDAEHVDTLLNPKVIVEILSASTITREWNEITSPYFAMPSTQACLLIDQDKVHVDVYIRQSNGKWLIDAAEGLDSVIQLEAIGCTLALADIYEKVEFSEVLPDEQDDKEQG